MEMFYPVDVVMTNELNPRLPITEIQELNEQMNCNLYVSDECENYFNSDILPEHVSVVDEMEMFMRDVECEVWN